MTQALLTTLIFFFTHLSFAQKRKEILYVGTMAVRESQGIYVFKYDPIKAKLTLLQTINDRDSPSFLTVHPNGKFLYAVNRMAVDQTHSEVGSVSAYQIDQKTGKLTLINHVSAFGKGPCHISVDRTGKFAFVSNYHEGNLVVYRLLSDGSLGEVTDSKKYSYNGKQSHVHCAIPSPDNKFLLVTDLGADKIYKYKLDLVNGRIIPADQPELSVAPGAGPRHLTFSMNGKNVYLAEELTSTIASFSYQPLTSSATILQDTLRAIPASYKDKNSSADIRVDPKGKYVYQSQRGLDALSIFAIGLHGKLKYVGTQSSAGKTPRNFVFTPSGQHLLVANQDTDNVVIFKQDAKTGKLRSTGFEVKVPSPVCLQFLKINQ
ncbi:lactonase family protein [Pseudochryseolinea flava]|uniref:lactonase family protein n=1 Tax=Pseudochryseolinea flava TaxID=2059302 RepID=UPI001FE5C11B|nr:lactonase family protein [Pseudochryseolinea flava]